MSRKSMLSVAVLVMAAVILVSMFAVSARLEMTTTKNAETSTQSQTTTKEETETTEKTTTTESTTKSTTKTTTEQKTEKKQESTAKKEQSGDKTVYLTFDDGPGRYTKELLDVLDKYNAKATFFVTNQYPTYRGLIKEEAKRGHTVAVHTYSHDYSKVYASESAYFKDLEKMNDIVEQQTGQRAWLIRFPGGSSNAVSKKYCPGLMTTLVKSVGEHGYYYADWNVDSGDASSSSNATEVANKVINDIQHHSVSVVLQHDTKGYSVDAVEKILQWGQEHGYTFKAMNKDSYMAHHGSLSN